MAAAKIPKSKKTTEREIISFDYAMKNILRDKANSGILAGFLTELTGRKVRVIAILESESNIDDPGDKINRVDIKAQIDGGEIVIFEIQYADQYDFFGKMLFNVGKAIVEQINSGNKYNVKKVYMIGIAEFELGAKRDYLFNAKIDQFRGLRYNEMIPFSQTRGGKPSPENPKIDIHPEYYLILPKKFDNEIRGRFDEWVYAIKNHAVKNDFKAAGIKEAAMKMDRLKMTPEQRLAYDRHLFNKSDIDTVFETGIMRGETKGYSEGVAKGETRKAMEIARELKTDGMPVRKIAKITGLAATVISKL